MGQNRFSAFFDLITVVFVVLTVGLIGLIVLILNDPNTPLNPFPPPTIPPVVILPSLTPSDTPTPTLTPSVTPTASPTPTATYTLTSTPTATGTPTATFTPTEVLVGSQPTPGEGNGALDDGSGNTISGSGQFETPTPIQTLSPYPFAAAEARYDANPGPEGCQWAGIAGTVTGVDGEPLPGIAVKITSANFNQVTYSGLAARLGEGGYEFVLGTTPIEGTYTLQLLDAGAVPVSEKILVETAGTCQRNLAIVEFIQNHAY